MADGMPNRDDGPMSEIPSTSSVVGQILDRIEAQPAKPCLVFHPQSLTISYGDLLQRSLLQAALLRSVGAGRGDVIMIFLPTCPALYAAIIGAMLLGAIPACMPCPSPKQEPGQYWRDHRSLLARTAPRAVLTDSTTAAAMRASGLVSRNDVTVLCVEHVGQPMNAVDIQAARLDDVALLQHSSGTTGLKKGVMLSNRAIIAQVGAYAQALHAAADDVVATWLPVYHDMGLISSTLIPLMLGQTIAVLDPFAWAADPASLLRAIDRYRATLVWQPNFAFEHLVRMDRPDDAWVDLSCVRAFVNCSEPCRLPTMARFADRFASRGVRAEQLQVSYAMAETVFAVTQTEPGHVARSLSCAAAALRQDGVARSANPGEQTVVVVSVGRPIAGMSLCVVGPDGAHCDDRVVGEVMVSGRCLFDGYFRLPDQTAERVTREGLRTRDMGFVVDGELFVLGRMDDLIIVHGQNFYAGEIEATANRVAGVKPGRAVAFGIDNEEVGSQDAVLVAETDAIGMAGAGLQRRIKAQVLQEMGLALQAVRVVPDGWLSKTTSGKISREHNKARYLSERGFG